MTTHEYPSGPPELHADWCRGLFATLNEGGVWAVPRSGMIFAKRDGRFVLVAEIPWMPEMEGTVTAAELREQQDAEFESIREHFGVAGIEVVKEVRDAETST